ncbi:MAG TPA: TetR/AcrR family transcriptional regulator [Pedobacter sp.]|nr:TetR/AcrR family transcriptional regulator [Pedobacter sp.]
MMNKGDRTRQFIIEKTAVLFNTKGYSGTSLSDITTVTGLTKGSIYGNFANKDEVAIAVYEYNSGMLSDKLDKAINIMGSATEKLVAAVNFYRDNWRAEFDGGGCPILNASVEADDNLPFLREKVRESIKKWGAKLDRIIREGQDCGEFRQRIISQDYAYIIITLVEGGIMLGKITGEEKHLFLALDRIDKIIKEDIIK